jgi:hypothetical protein
VVGVQVVAPGTQAPRGFYWVEIELNNYSPTFESEQDARLSAAGWRTRVEET